MARKFSLFFICVMFASSCAVKTVKTGPSKTASGTSPSPVVTASPVDAGDSSQTQVADHEFSDSPQYSATPLPKSVPRIGLILSGGGAKAWAHVGVLKEIEKAKWPVKAVAGVEWGAVAAASFAHGLSANEVEWKMSKVKNLQDVEDAAEIIFENTSVSDLKVPFVCSSLNITQQQVFLLNRGSLQNLIPFCLAQFPLTSPYKQSVSSMSDIRSLAQHLKATGVKKVIYVNVLAQKKKRPFTDKALSAENAIWASAAAQSDKRISGVDDVIQINLDDYDIDDLDNRREMMAIGAELSYDQIKNISRKYGL